MFRINTEEGKTETEGARKNCKQVPKINQLCSSKQVERCDNNTAKYWRTATQRICSHASNTFTNLYPNNYTIVSTDELLSLTWHHCRFYLAVDRELNFCTVAIYNIHSSAVKQDDLLSIVDPTLEEIQVDCSSFAENTNGKHQFLNVRIPIPLKLLINQQQIPDSSIVSPSLSIQTFLN